MALTNDPLAWNIPIVDSEGRPTPEFLLKWANLGAITGDIPAFDTPAEVSAVLDVLGSTRGSLLVRTNTGWVILPPGSSGRVLTSAGAGADPGWAALPAFPSIQTLLDTISNVRGTVLYRGASGWAALAPGTAGYVLSTGGPSADPSWVAQSGGGGGGTVPTIVQEAAAIVSTGACAITLPAAPTAGNLLIACVSEWNSAFTLAAGWTQLFAQSGTLTADLGRIVYRQAGAGESATQTPYTNNSSWDIVMFEIADAAVPSLVSFLAECSIASSTVVACNLGVPGNALGIGMFMAQNRTAPTLTITGATGGSSASGARTNGGPSNCQSFHQTGLTKGAWQPSCTFSTSGTNGRIGVILGPL